MHQTNQIAEDTIIELDKQGRKIEKMERDMEIVEDNTNQAERHVRGLKSVFGRIANKFSKNDSYREQSQVEPRQTTESMKNIQAGTSGRNQSNVTVLNDGPKTSSADLIQGDGAEEQRLKQQLREQDADLDEIQGALGRMHGMALDMNVEINDQNRRLDSLHNRVQTSNVRIEKNSREVKKMI